MDVKKYAPDLYVSTQMSGNVKSDVSPRGMSQVDFGPAFLDVPRFRRRYEAMSQKLKKLGRIITPYVMVQGIFLNAVVICLFQPAKDVY